MTKTPDSAQPREMSEDQIREVFEMLKLSVSPTEPTVRTGQDNQQREILYFPVSGSSSPLKR